MLLLSSSLLNGFLKLALIFRLGNMFLLNNFTHTSSLVQKAEQHWVTSRDGFRVFEGVPFTRQINTIFLFLSWKPCLKEVIWIDLGFSWVWLKHVFSVILDSCSVQLHLMHFNSSHAFCCTPQNKGLPFVLVWQISKDPFISVGFWTLSLLSLPVEH